MVSLIDRLTYGCIMEPWSIEPRQILADALEDAGDDESQHWRSPPVAQLSRLPDCVANILPRIMECWLDIGLAVGPCDRAQAVAAVNAAYAVAGLAPPRVVIWLSSPLEGWVGSYLLRHLLSRSGVAVGARVYSQTRDRASRRTLDQVSEHVSAQITTQVVDQIRSMVRDEVSHSVVDRVYDLVVSQVADRVEDRVVASVSLQVQEQVAELVMSQLMGQIADEVVGSISAHLPNRRLGIGHCGYGQHDASWLAYYVTLELAGISCAELHPLMRLASCCGWWWSFDGAVILTERPVELITAGRQLVRVVYADGFTVTGD